MRRRALGGGAYDTVGQIGAALRFGEPVELVGERGTADRVQQGANVDHAVERPGRGDGAGLDLAGGVVLGGFSVGALTPVVDHAAGVGEAQRLALLDQGGFVVGEQAGAVAVVGCGQQIDVLGRQ